MTVRMDVVSSNIRVLQDLNSKNREEEKKSAEPQDGDPKSGLRLR